MQDDDELCGRCNGSGEGMYDGTRCGACGGSGIERDYESDYERRCEAADRYNDERKEER